MKKIKMFFDYIFTATIMFLFFCVWCNFYFKSIKKTFIPAIMLTIIFMCILHVILRTIREKNAQKLKLIKDAKQTFLELLHSENAQTLISKAYIGGGYIFCKISKNEICQQDLINAITAAKQKQKNKIAVFCENVPSKIAFAANAYKDYEFEFFDFLQIHKLLENANLVPPKTIEFKSTKISFKQFLNLLFLQDRSRSYFLIALFLAFTCFFTPFKIYYACFTSLFIILAVISKFKKLKYI